MPALLTRMSTRPQRSIVRATMSATCVGLADVGAVRDRLAAGADDLVRDALRRLGRAARAVHVAAEVVDHDPRAPRRERQRVRPAEAGAPHR